MADKLDPKELLWRQYQLQIDLYKFYFELTVKFTAFYFAVTGAILSFYFSKIDVGLIRFSLDFPILMSVGFGGIYLFGARLLGVTRQDIFDLRDTLDLDVAPDAAVLTVFLLVNAILMIIVALVLAYLFFTNPPAEPAG